MQDRLNEELKTLFLAGVGAAAVTAEKTKALVGELVEKGRLTVDVVAEFRVIPFYLEIHHRSGPVSRAVPPDSEADQLLRSLDRMSPEDLAALKAKLAAMDAAEDPHGKPES